MNDFEKKAGVYFGLGIILTLAVSALMGSREALGALVLALGHLSSFYFRGRVQPPGE